MLLRHLSWLPVFKSHEFWIAFFCSLACKSERFAIASGAHLHEQQACAMWLIWLGQSSSCLMVSSAVNFRHLGVILKTGAPLLHSEASWHYSLVHICKGFSERMACSSLWCMDNEGYQMLQICIQQADP